MPKKKRSASSRRWLDEHETDPWVRKAREDGYRSRAVYKLQEIDEKDRLIRKGMSVVDLGAAPGGWLQYVLRRTGGQVRLFGLDLLPIEPVEGRVLQGFIEKSNVNPVTEIARMIEVQRGYELSQKFLEREDERIRSAVRLLGQAG